MTQKVTGDHNVVIDGNGNSVIVQAPTVVPIHFNPDDVLAIVKCFSDHIEDIEIELIFPYIEKPDKNSINNMSSDYFSLIKEHSMPYFDQVESILRDPRQKITKSAYKACAHELNRKLITYRSKFENFDQVMEWAFEDLFQKCSSILKVDNRVIRIVLDYMYFSCDLGKRE